MSPVGGRSFGGATALGAAATVVCVLPLFLAGALALELRRDLTFSTAGLGIAVATFWLVNAVTSVPLGRLTDRWGAVIALRVTAVTAAVSALGIALFAQRWLHLVIGLGVGGAAHAIGQPAANRLLVTVSSPARLGLAFGLKSAAPPAASMLAGLSVPAIALTVGWRWAFIAAGPMALLVFVFAGRRPPPAARQATRPREQLRDRSAVLGLSAAFGLAVAASTSVPSFYVDAAVSAGASPQAGGLGLALASLMALATRIVSGWSSDRWSGGHLRLCAGLLATGSLGMFLLASGWPGAMAVGVVIALIGSWGFNAVFWYALVREQPEVPGRLTGAVAPGGAVGGIAGPALFGIIAERAGFGPAWVFLGAITIAASVGLELASRRLQDRRLSRTTAEAAEGEDAT